MLDTLSVYGTAAHLLFLSLALFFLLMRRRHGSCTVAHHQHAMPAWLSGGLRIGLHLCCIAYASMQPAITTPSQQQHLLTPRPSTLTLCTGNAGLIGDIPGDWASRTTVPLSL